MKRKESERLASTVRDLSLYYEEAANLMKEVTKETKFLKPLWGKPDAGAKRSSQLIKAGVSLIAFPIPTIGIKKSIGAILIAAGLVQERMKQIRIADVSTTFQDLCSKIQTFHQE